MWDLLFACPCTNRQSLITAVEILPWSWKFHVSKLTPKTFYFHLLTLQTFLDLLTLEEQNYLMKFILLPFLQMFDAKQTAFHQEKGEVLYCKPGNRMMTEVD